MKIYILDACALIAVLNKEAGAEVVRDLLNLPKTQARVYMNVINLLELYYGILREYGKDKANDILVAIRSSSIEFIETIANDAFMEAGRLKARHKMSLADSIVLAEGIVRNAVVVSSDHHEFDTVEQNEDIVFLWIR